MEIVILAGVWLENEYVYILNVYITVIFRSFWLDYFHDYVETVMFASECGTAACVRREPVGGKAAAEL